MHLNMQKMKDKTFFYSEVLIWHFSVILQYINIFPAFTCIYSFKTRKNHQQFAPLTNLCLSTARFVWILLFPFICILNVQHSMFTQLTQECFSVRSHSNPTFSHSIHSGICFSYFLWWIIYILLLFLLLHRRKSFVLVFSFISISFLA